ncbi:hypothetical protein BDZ97DRAFT_1708414 [Flammula alnicola]|nr:hypothetical protein BDZ97DRAFT_1708414 [Flammula alnicola]
MATMVEGVQAPVSDAALELKERANRLYSSKEYSAAASIYSMIINQFSKNGSPMFIKVIQCNRAACLIELGRYQDAIQDLQEVIRSNLNIPEAEAVIQKAHFRLARCLCELGRYGDAIKEMDKYRELVGGQPKESENGLRMKILLGLTAHDQTIPEQFISPPRARPTPSQPTASGNTRQLRYEVKIFNVNPPIVRYDMVPISLCSPRPPEIPTKVFLAQLVKKYHDEIMSLQTWKCWICNKSAVSLVHTPASYLHQAEPKVVDFAQPVCVNGGQCEKEARQLMEEEMRKVAAGGMPGRF